MFSTELLPRSASQHVKDATIAAATSFGMLFLQQIVMKHAVNDFQTLGGLLFAVFVLQAAVLGVATATGGAGRGKKTTAVVINVDARTLTKVLYNGARVFVQCWIRADALHHFGFLFAFLLENVDLLLLQPLRDAVAFKATSAQHGSGGTNNTWLLVLMGYVLVAGVDAYEYGSLLHTFLLIGLALGMRELQNRTPEAKMRLSSSPQFHLLSLLGACAITVPLSLVVGTWRVREEVEFNQRAGVEPMGNTGWTACLFVAAAFQTASSHFARNNDSIASSRGRWLSLMACSSTGLLSSLIVSASQDDWLRCVADTLASLVIIYAQFAQFQSASATTQYGSRDEEELDMYRSGGSSGAVATTSMTHIFRVLWEKEDSRKILLFLSVNVSYMFVELVVGFWTNSLGLIGDAGHMFFDNGALVIGLIASYIGKLPADAQYTYGYGRVEVLSGFLNSIFLLFISFHLMAEASSRFFDPPEVSTENLLLTSTVGLLVNIVGLVWFHDQVHGHGHSHGDGGGCGSSSHKSHSHGDVHGGHGHSHGHSHGHEHQPHGEDANAGGLHQGSSSGGGGSSSSNSNMYGVYLHVLADTMGSVGVIVSSLLIEYKGWHVADPLSSAMISLLIFGSTLPLLKDTLLQLLQRVPKEMEQDLAHTLEEVRTTVPGLVSIEQWHFWRHVNDVCVGTLHVVIDEQASEQVAMQRIRAIYKRRLDMDQFLSIQVTKHGSLGSHVAHSHHGHVHKHDNSHHDGHHYHRHGHEGDTHHHSHDSHSGMSTYENPAGDDAMFARHHASFHQAAAAATVHAKHSHWQHDHQHAAPAHSGLPPPPVPVPAAKGFLSKGAVSASPSTGVAWQRTSPPMPFNANPLHEQHHAHAHNVGNHPGRHSHGHAH